MTVLGLPIVANQTDHIRVHLVQGEYHVTDARDVVLTTILGSCVAACIRDPLVGVGGMNHFLLPDQQGPKDAPDAMRYGAHAMELLINGLLSRGAKRERLEAKLFGGARMVLGLTDIGKRNGEFAQRFLQQESISIHSSSLGGFHARRVQFWPQSGRVRQMALSKTSAQVFARERMTKPRLAENSGALELF